MTAARPRLSWAKEALVRRSLILAEREDAGVQDLRDCAGILLEVQEEEAAARLLDVAELCASPPGGLPAQPSLPSHSTWDAAVSELDEMISAIDRRRGSRADIGENSGASSPALFTTVIPSDRWLREAFGPALRRLLDIRRPGRSPECAEWASESAKLLQNLHHWGPVPLQSHAPDELYDLATALAYNVTRRTLIRMAQLGRPPYGDPVLFAMSLRWRGLGVGFRNIRALAPTWLELRSLVRTAWACQARLNSYADTLDRFAVLLSSGLPAPLLQELVDDVADAGRLEVLAGITSRLLHHPLDDIDQNVLRTTRDAHLDLGNLELAIDVQRRLVERERGSAALAALGEVRGLRASDVPYEAASGLVIVDSSDLFPRTIAREALGGETEYQPLRHGFASTAAQRGRRFVHSLRQWPLPTSVGSKQ